MKCFLDLDGVLIDHQLGAHQFLELPYSYDEYPYELGVSENRPPQQGNLTTDKLWNTFDRHFWTWLPWMHDGRVILAAVERIFGKENICIFTKPTNNPGSVIGKINWIKREIPDYRKQFLIGSNKSVCASSDCVLIDDRDRNVDAFIDVGGQAILVPRLWNSAYHQKTIEQLCDQLVCLKVES